MRKRKKVILASLLAGMFIFQQSMLMSVLATDITGVTGNNGVYNINPVKASNGIGIRQYDNFNLSQNDIANLIMHLNGTDLSTFLNLVQNGVSIDGILNTVDKNGAFANGKAVFVTPGGVVIGNHGVINVGSLEAYSNSISYDNLKNKYDAADPNITMADIENINPKFATGNITVDGKVISRGDVTIIGKNVNVGQGGHIVANANVGNILADNGANETLFQALVNTDGAFTDAQQAFMTNRDGQLIIHAQGGANIAGNVVNYAKGTLSSTIVDNSLNDTDANGFVLASTGNITAAGGQVTLMNNMGDMNLAGNVRNENGSTTIGNTGRAMDDQGQLIDEPSSDSKLTLSGNVFNKGGKTLIYNTGNNGMVISGNVNNTNGDTEINNGFRNNETPYNTAGMNITGNVTTTNGNTSITNFLAGVDGMHITGNVTTNQGNATITNHGQGGMNIKNNAKIKTTGNATFKNEQTGRAGMNISNNADIQTTGNATFTNLGRDGMNFTDNAKVTTTGTSTFTNRGEKGLNVKDNSKITSNGYLLMDNYGRDGMLIAPGAQVLGHNNALLRNDATGGIRIQGHVTTDQGTTNIESKNGDVILGHDDTNNNVTAKKDINITTTNASILNYAHDSGVVKLHSYDGAKTFLVADGNLNMKATDGRIGDLVEGVCQSGNCTGIGPLGVRDFNKSINANIKGKVNAQTIDTSAAKQNEYVINYAAIDSDMNIDQIKANGRVILTIDADSQDRSVQNADGTYKYNMKNAATDPTKANVEGWGISLISSGNIGTQGNKLTFNQTKPGTLRTAANDGLTNGNAYATDGYGMDVLANGDINIKGLDDQYTVNNICSMVSRKGSIDAEFSGNTYIDEVTAKKNIKLVTRGKTMEINHLGTVPTLGDHGQNGDAVYDTYLGTGERVADNGSRGDDDGRGYDSATPNNAIVKALDINKNISPLREGPVDKNGDGDKTYPAYADSTVVVRNAMLEVEGNKNGDLDITADNIYANGIVAHFNKNGFSKDVDNRTNPTIGGNTPTGHAVRPEDVTDIGRNDHERNYYYPKGDGDLPPNGIPNTYRPGTGYRPVDPNNGIAEATPLIMPVDGPVPPPPVPPEPDPRPDPDPDTPRAENFWKKEDSNNVEAIDKRQYMRFRISDNKNPVTLEKNDNGILELLDLSRGGIAVRHDGSLKTGDVLPIHLTYGDMDVHANVKVVSATTSRAGAEFVNLDKATANQLLFLSILLEDKNVAFKK